MKKSHLSFIILILSFVAKGQDSAYYPLRCLGINVGNVGFTCWESKLCDQSVVTSIRNYIQTWSPDIIMISEVYKKSQMDSTEFNGPILPPGYACDCGKSLHRSDSLLTGWDSADASHEHECIAWKTALLSPVESSEKSVYGRNDSYGMQNCNYDFTAHSLRLVYKNFDTITPVALHPNSMYSQCRVFEIANYWDSLCNHNKTIIAGDWNTDVTSELQVPANFRTIFSKGHYWDLHYSSSDYSQTTFLGSRHLDHAFANFGTPCINCGSYYGGVDLPYGAALGGYNSHPRADAGAGMDHRQILMDIKVKCALPQPQIQFAQSGDSYTYSCTALNGEFVFWDFGNGITSDSISPSYIDSSTAPHWVKLTLTNGCGSKTDSIGRNSVGVNTVQLKHNVTVYPNPAGNSFIIETGIANFEDNLMLEMLDLQGKLVLKQKLVLDSNGRDQIDIQALLPSTYLIAISQNKRIVYSSKILKQK